MHTLAILLLLLLSLSLPTDVAAGGHGHGGHGNGGGYRQYRDVEEWLSGLPPEQGARARAILDEERPAIQELRARIHAKMDELDSLSYNANTPSDALPRLGWELQTLRDELRARYRHVRQRLLDEAGVDFPGHRGRGCRSMIKPAFPQ